MSDNFSLNQSATIFEVVERLNQGVGGMIVLTDEDRVVRGVMTDGDIRRALLNGLSLQSPAVQAMKTSFVAGSSQKSEEENVALLDDRIRHVPVLDEEGRLTDIISWSRLWRAPISAPFLGGNELKYVSDCIARSWISSQGEYIRKFEATFAEYHGVRHALSVANGTCALHLALVAAGVGPGHSVAVPNLTFGASANAVIHAGAKPVFIDVDPVTWNLDSEDLRRKLTPEMKAVMPVHLYGHPCDMEPILELASAHRLTVVEDCAEALGARYRGQLVGTFGQAGCFSFFANKVITTGEGGMVVTNDSDLYKRLVLYRDHGMEPSRRYWHLVPGFNYRMTNLQAAVGLAQMEQIEDFLQRMGTIDRFYREELGDFAEMLMPPSQPGCEPVCWLFTLLLRGTDHCKLSREDLIRYLASHGIDSRPMFYPLDQQPAYGSFAGTDCPVSHSISPMGLSLPTSKELSEDQVRLIGKTVANFVKNHRLLTEPNNLSNPK